MEIDRLSRKKEGKKNKSIYFELYVKKYVNSNYVV